MEEKLGIILHKGQMYDLDTLPEEELEKLLLDIENYSKRLDTEAEIIADN